MDEDFMVNGLPPMPDYEEETRGKPSSEHARKSAPVEDFFSSGEEIIEPKSIEAEQSVLGALLIAPELFDPVAEILKVEDFYLEENRMIFKAIQDMNEARRGVDALTVAEWLQDHEQLAMVGGMQYMIALATETPSVINAEEYARIIRDRATLRALIKMGDDVKNLAYSPDGRETSDLINAAELYLTELIENRENHKKDYVAARDALGDVIDHIETVARLKKAITGLPSGFEYLDELTSGFHPGQLIIVAARPSMGKTSFAMNVVEHIGCKEDKPVLVFSMEMPREELILRSISSLGQISLKRLRNGQLNNDDWGRLSNAVPEIGKSSIFVDDSSGLNPAQIRTRARRMQREHGLSMIVIDYLQLMRSTTNHRQNRVAEISEISRDLKEIAKELDVPVIALSQLNRSLESRTDKRPQMSDIRDSGAIEQDADLIVFLYRDEVYNKENEEVKGIAELIVGKNRNGPTGTARVKFEGEYTRFKNDVNMTRDQDYG